MEHKCPACDREFESVSDYPRVYVAKVARIPLPAEASFITRDEEIYHGPKLNSGNERPPKQVLDYFKENPEAGSFEHEGWTWTLRDNRPRGFQGVRDRIKRLFGTSACELRPEKWEIGVYSRSKRGQFSTDTIMRSLNPYLDHLESLVGKEVSSSEVLPKFGNDRYCYNVIPGTHYGLMLEELDRFEVSQMLKQEKLPIPDLETPQPTRKIAFAIIEPGRMVNFRAVVGGLAYEGRLKK